MELGLVALVAGAGVLGGVANAIAGGGSLITFPALLAAGLPPVIANATNALAASPAHPMAAWADREALPPLRELRPLIRASLVGGALGAGMLLVTPERWFTLMVPALIALATLVFAFAGPIQRALAPRRDAFDPDAALRPGFACAVYGGYFGAGLGIMLMAVLRVAGLEAPRQANAVKNLLASVAVAGGLVLLLAAGLVAWGAAAAMLAGTLAGGWIGGRLARVMPAALLRALVIVTGAAMTAVQAWRLWL
ncbi:MAG: sulfite exporter TauE/SafE family protein [Acetobacteraceae bacterium]|nr:sulfite exporter TauE/SafE family protein [Acetobacteraceae bacterium]